jgi:predicted DCC family thiol-disulfide oxidoreductase YuxK
MSDSSSGSANPRHRVLWDGDCVFCGQAARWCQRKDVGGRLELVPYQQAPSPPMTDALRRACADALHVVCSDGRVLRAGRAMLFAYGELGHPRIARLFARRPLIWAVEIFYWGVARNRQRLSRLLFRGEAEASPARAASEEREP